MAAQKGEAAQGCLEHLAFTVDTLDDLRAVRDRVAATGAGIRTSDHGNAWALYFTDPDGNGVEAFATSSFQVQQSFGRALDLDRPDKEIPAATRQASNAR